MPTPDSIGHTLQHYAECRFRRFSSTALRDLSAPSPAFCTITGPYLEFLAHHAQPICQWLDARLPSQAPDNAVAFFARHMIRFLYDKNQFVRLEESHTQDLNALYHTFLTDFRYTLSVAQSPDHLQATLNDVFAAHQFDLEQFVRALHDPAGLREVVCSEYSPELQLAILHLAADQLADPVLDIGCGAHGQLVHYLRQRGKAVLGIDRAPADDAYLIPADWFDFPLDTAAWGTVISHMAFSNHFLHHHLNPQGQAESYAQRYMAILNALKPGGQFIYTPGLPFIENLLPADQYRVERYPIPGAVPAALEVALTAQVGASVWYACQVTADHCHHAARRV